jgi:phosphate transport system substrate-binding protein
MKLRRISLVAVLVLAAVIGVAACGSSSPSKSSGSKTAVTIDGSGSTSAAPIYAQWALNEKSSGLTINYLADGSGSGIANLAAKTDAFAGDDPALTSTDVASFKGAPVLEFPVAAGAYTVSYNLPGVHSGLKLTGPVIAEIFSGKITKWNSSAITALNPGVTLPSTAISVIHRSDSAGTTAGFTKYLSEVSPTWAKTIGTGKLVTWPVGTGASKNSGVAAAVKATVGAVGYIEQAYALENNFTYAAIKNSAGNWELPTIASTSAAFSGLAIPADLGVSTINSPDPAAYPIVSQTFLDVYQDPCKDGGLTESTAKGVYDFLSYAFGAGQKTMGSASGDLPYAPVPTALDQKDLTQLATMTCNGKSLA